ncbi:hypothetical protein BC829DRAFT_438567 [Chytridium lagenaria]|nr:hypothetical protein BC829DRAFT_438567 [Chytridium lagenaria]
MSSQPRNPVIHIRDPLPQSTTLLSYKDPTKNLPRTWESCERIQRPVTTATVATPIPQRQQPLPNERPQSPVERSQSPLLTRRTSTSALRSQQIVDSPSRIHTTTTMSPDTEASSAIPSPLTPFSPIPKTAPRGRFDAVDILATLKGPWPKEMDGTIGPVSSLIDPDDESLESAALRELSEETGFTGKVLSVAPGPCSYEAAMTSSCGVLVRLEAINPHVTPDATPPSPKSPDADEWSLIPVIAPLKTLPEDIEGLMDALAKAGKGTQLW